MFSKNFLEREEFETLACKPPEDLFLGIFPIKYFLFFCIKNVGKRVGWYKECFVKTVMDMSALKSRGWREGISVIYHHNQSAKDINTFDDKHFSVRS